MANEFNFDQHPMFQYFYRMNQIPRGSGNEKAVSDELVKIGKELGADVHQDEVNNVFIDLPATEGLEKVPKLLMQGHMDMVCVKAKDSDHDFLKDPIEMYEDKGWLTAKGTTLGADDAIGVCYGLAFMKEAKEHPALRLIVTVDEEEGMAGVLGLAPEELAGKHLVNIDSEEEGLVTCGCAGGATGEFQLPLTREKKEGQKVLRLEISKMRGGHSGNDILEVNTSAMKTMAQLLRKVKDEVPFSLYDFVSGTKHNAIPSEAIAILGVCEDRVEALKAAIIKAQNEILETILKVEPDIHFELTETEAEKEALVNDVATNLLNLVETLPHGVYTMREDGERVESSDNLAILETKEKQAEFTVSIRSNKKSKLTELQDKIMQAFRLYHAEGAYKDGYPSWEYKEESLLRDLYNQAYEKRTGEKPEVLVIHAGLECGIFAEKNPELDMISIGPDITGAHSIKERLNIESAYHVYEDLKNLIAQYVEVYKDRV